MTQPDPNRRQFCRRAGAVATAFGTAGLVATSASAQTSQQGILADGVSGDVAFDPWTFIGGQLAGLSVLSWSEDAEVLADQIRNEFNANSEHWIAYGNWLIAESGVTALGDTTVGVDIQVSKTLGDDEIVPTTIDVGYNTETDEFTSLEWRLEEADDPDYEAVVMDDAAENGSDELAEFRREFIDTDGNGNHELPSSEYINHHAGKYSRYIGLGDDGQTVFELLLGEVDV
ncbi:hypothetical protein [Natrinema sp. DC36]|uniref:hypothetical protein n=1 Tax=Natrinema sp. DC36 TaxID=2878680 RepID=UPI001CF0B125|nr:hypothetical protein [Natrinema sp. DC36]